MKLYNKEINKINGNVIAIMLVGSYPHLQKGEGKDIDIFVILDEGSNQTRRIKIIDGVELDINYFPLEVAKRLIADGEYFFIYELSERASVLLDTGYAETLIKNARIRYQKGPKKATHEDICLMKHETDALIRRTITETDVVQRNINAVSCLAKMLKAYFTSRGIWCPKEKNIVNALRENDETLYLMAKEFIEDMDTENLEKISEKVFHNVCMPDELNIEY
ncbi:nucleotidyltransferase domain-containing protein [Peptoclostridium acidaminophilum]|uniref:nucleotidyltransferase domain-containing protein n=1 Tax=Peptoclostridium acidaminophilum TaxID=1731 RepID=UPI001A9A4BA0|nr:nucleotidyltransferase domain-containing protein [Peptoclostridium acidaminophilum]